MPNSWQKILKYSPSVFFLKHFFFHQYHSVSQDRQGTTKGAPGSEICAFTRRSDAALRGLARKSQTPKLKPEPNAERPTERSLKFWAEQQLKNRAWALLHSRDTDHHFGGPQPRSRALGSVELPRANSGTYKLRALAWKDNWWKTEVREES